MLAPDAAEHVIASVDHAVAVGVGSAHHARTLHQRPAFFVRPSIEPTRKARSSSSADAAAASKVDVSKLHCSAACALAEFIVQARHLLAKETHHLRRPPLCAPARRERRRGKCESDCSAAAAAATARPTCASSPSAASSNRRSACARPHAREARLGVLRRASVARPDAFGEGVDGPGQRPRSSNALHRLSNAVAAAAAAVHSPTHAQRGRCRCRSEERRTRTRRRSPAYHSTPRGDRAELGHPTGRLRHPAGIAHAPLPPPSQAPLGFRRAAPIHAGETARCAAPAPSGVVGAGERRRHARRQRPVGGRRGRGARPPVARCRAGPQRQGGAGGAASVAMRGGRPDRRHGVARRPRRWPATRAPRRAPAEGGIGVDGGRSRASSGRLRVRRCRAAGPETCSSRSVAGALSRRSAAPSGGRLCGAAQGGAAARAARAGHPA